MDITTTRFGITIDEDVLTFVDGLIGMEDCRRWALLADAQNSTLGWLQSLDRPEVVLAVVCPRRFVPDYRRGSRGATSSRSASINANDAQVLAIVNQVGDSLALNLKAPLVVHVATRLGRQIVAKDDHAVQHLLTRSAAAPHGVRALRSSPSRTAGRYSRGVPPRCAQPPDTSSAFCAAKSLPRGSQLEWRPAGSDASIAGNVAARGIRAVSRVSGRCSSSSPAQASEICWFFPDSATRAS